MKDFSEIEWDQTQYHSTGRCWAAGPTSSHSPAPCSKPQEAQQQHLPSKRASVNLYSRQAHTVLCREQSTGFKTSEWLFLLRNRKVFGSHSLTDLSSALPQFTVNRWDITFKGNQELVGFHTAAQGWNPPGRQGYCQRFNYCLL